MERRPARYPDSKTIRRMIRGGERLSSCRKPFPPYTLIVCEGSRTEPNYLNGLVGRINDHCADTLRNDHITVIGTGRNTRGLLRWVRAYAAGSPVRYSRIWLVYDKDDFPSDNFDNTQFSIDSTCDPGRKYRSAWSNPCIELWFVLYFQDVYSDLERQQYRAILKRYFTYRKSMPDLYEQLSRHGSITAAIARAEKLYRENKNSSPSRMAPATRMHELMEELLGYM